MSLEESTQIELNHIQTNLKLIITNLLQTNNTIRFLEYYGKSMTPEIIKDDENTNIINRHKKFFQGIDTRRKGRT